MSKSSKARPRTRLTAAQLKAYEARRATEVNHLGGTPVAPVVTSAKTAPARRVYVLSPTEEMGIIRSDLKRLLLILAILVVVLIVMTIFLR